IGGVTIDNGTLDNETGGYINVSGADTIENELGNGGGGGTDIFTNTGLLTVGSLDTGTPTLGTLTLSQDWVNNFTTPGGPTPYGTIAVTGDGTLDLIGGVTIDNGEFNNAGHIYVSGAGNEIENEAGSGGGGGSNIFTNTGTLTVGSLDTGTPTLGTLTLSQDWVNNFTTPGGPTPYGTIAVTGDGTLDLIGGVTIDNGVFSNAGHIYVSGAGNEIENEAGSGGGGGSNIFTNTGLLTVGSLDTGTPTLGTLTLSQDWVNNFTTPGGPTPYGTIAVTGDGTLDLIGGVTIDDGVFGNAGHIYVSGADTIENELGNGSGGGTDIFTNTGLLTVGSLDTGTPTLGTLTLSQDWVNNFTTPGGPTPYGTIAVTGDGTLDLIGGVTIDDGVFGNAGHIYVSGADTIENELGNGGGLGSNIFTNTGTLTVGGTDVGGTTTPAVG